VRYYYNIARGVLVVDLNGEKIDTTTACIYADWLHSNELNDQPNRTRSARKRPYLLPSPKRLISIDFAFTARPRTRHTEIKKEINHRQGSARPGLGVRGGARDKIKRV
jgi:hypothetical protein